MIALIKFLITLTQTLQQSFFYHLTGREKPDTGISKQVLPVGHERLQNGS